MEKEVDVSSIPKCEGWTNISSQQLDSNELWSELLKQLSVETGTEFLTSMFTGNLKVVTVPRKEDAVTNYSAFYDIPLQVQGFTSLEQALKAYVKPTNNGGVWTMTDILAFPDILKFSLNRSLYNEKCNDRFEFAEYIDLNEYVSEGTKDNKFDLTGVLSHKSYEGIKSGHYVAHLLVENEWFAFDDINVFHSSAENAIRGNFGNETSEFNACGLIYRRRGYRVNIEPNKVGISLLRKVPLDQMLGKSSCPCDHQGYPSQHSCLNCGRYVHNIGCSKPVNKDEPEGRRLCLYCAHSAPENVRNDMIPEVRSLEHDEDYSGSRSLEHDEQNLDVLEDAPIVPIINDDKHVAMEDDTADSEEYKSLQKGLALVGRVPDHFVTFVQRLLKLRDKYLEAGETAETAFEQLGQHLSTFCDEAEMFLSRIEKMSPEFQEEMETTTNRVKLMAGKLKQLIDLRQFGQLQSNQKYHSREYKLVLVL